MKAKRAIFEGSSPALGMLCRVFVPGSNWMTSLILGSIFLQGMLSEKKLVGFLDDYELPVQRETMGGVATENETPTDDDWGNL